MNLTGRQIEVLSLVAHGFSTTEIAKKLWVNEKTVDRHLQRAYQRLGAANRPHAVFLATKQGLIPDEPPGGAL